MPLAPLDIALRQVTFLKSAPTLKHCPPDLGREVAFAGRSNAGKSSAINTLCGQRQLARASKTPGRTQLINFFTVLAEQTPTEERRLVDLPGYGYAKVAKTVKEDWQQHLEHYLQDRESLRGLILLMDIRHPLTTYDQHMLTWAHSAELPVHILLTKADKLAFGAAKNALLAVQRDLKQQQWLATVQLFSALKRQGLEEVTGVLAGWLEWPQDLPSLSQ